ncbi:TRNA pseudouridine(55) synthase [Aphelenchoides bicaudatus]|nr:TRNA pseudouridine(55) synthase [Aphelenchoides bicaudatus]
MILPLCKSCALITQLEPDQREVVNEEYKCVLCFGILSNLEFRKQIVKEVGEKFKSSGYDGWSVVLAINSPITLLLREVIMSSLFGDVWNAREMSAKNLFSNLLQKDIEIGTELKGSLSSNLTLTISIENEEFDESDMAYLTTNFLKHFMHRKRKGNNDNNTLKSLYTRVKIQEIVSSMTKELAGKYKFLSPSKLPGFSISFERESIYIGGRYCKFSRALPQSAWTCDPDIPVVEGNSVSEKITAPMVKYFKASGTRFISSGREDIDVKMLGNGRPFAVNLINAKLYECLHGAEKHETLKRIQDEINKNTDIYVSDLFQLNLYQAEKLNNEEEEKRKYYSALCYSTVPVTKEMLKRLEESAPVTIQQDTVIRVLKRRPLHTRPRDIYKIRAFQMDDYHFMLKLETQAGTYIKEFVHGDLNRTTPSVGELLGVGADKVDILELDVEAVDLEWPPK